jgi:hypothetical protein
MSYRNVSMSLFPIFLPISISRAREFLSLCFFRRNASNDDVNPIDALACFLPSSWTSSQEKYLKMRREKKSEGKKERNGHEWSKWVKRMKKVKRKLKVIYCIECAALKCTFQRRTERVTFQFRCSSVFFAQDVNVMNMLMLISWKGSTLLKTHPSCSTVAYIFSHFMWCMCSLLLGKNFFAANFAENKVFFCIIKTNNRRERQKSVLGAKTINRNVSKSHAFIKFYVSSIKFIENLWVFSS